jgi:hypothetical protein
VAQEVSLDDGSFTPWCCCTAMLELIPRMVDGSLQRYQGPLLKILLIRLCFFPFSFFHFSFFPRSVVSTENSERMV